MSTVRVAPISDDSSKESSPNGHRNRRGSDFEVPGYISSADGEAQGKPVSSVVGAVDGAPDKPAVRLRVLNRRASDAEIPGYLPLEAKTSGVGIKVPGVRSRRNSWVETGGGGQHVGSKQSARRDVAANVSIPDPPDRTLC